MQKRKLHIVECADPYCTNRVKTTSTKKVKLCPDCAAQHAKIWTRRAIRKRKMRGAYAPFDPDEALDKKLCAAEFLIQYDAAPEEESFPKDARITRQELKILLKHRYLRPGSLVLERRTQEVYQVTVCQRSGRYKLQPFLSGMSLPRSPN
jgi:hypothetical protein